MKRLCLLLASLLALASSPMVQAHGYVLRAVPADRSTLERPPTRLQYWFSEALEPRFSEIKLRDQSGQVIASGGVDEKNHALLALRPPPGLPDGAYIVELRPAFASDGHVIAESRVFFIGDEVGGVAGQAPDDRAIPLEVLWRALLNLANFLFFGASTLYVAVLLPAWGGRGPDGLPARIMGRLRYCLIFSLLIAFAASSLALLQQSMVFFNTSADQVISQNLWQVVLIGSRFGDVWTFRLVLLIFAAVLVFVSEYYRPVMPQLAAGIWRGMPWLGALLIGASMVTSHAAGSTLLPWVAIAVAWLHALAVAFWLGGTLVLVLLLPIALRSYEREARERARRAVMRRFSTLAAPLVALVIVSGAYNALNFFLTPADLGSSYGRSLGVKLLLLAPALLVGGFQHIALRPELFPRLRAAGRHAPRFLIASATKFARGAKALRLEAALMLCALVAVAWLSATPIPEPQSLQPDIAAQAAAQSVGAFTVSAAIVPGGPGVNTYDLLLSRAGQTVTDARVYFQLINPARERRGPWHRMEEVESGLYAAAGDDIDAAGAWWSAIDIIEPNGSLTRAAFAWTLSDSASIQQMRQPEPLNLLALLLVACVLCLIVYPRGRRLYARLNVSPVSALLASGAVAVAAGVMLFGALLLGEGGRDYERTLHPPPSVINTVLPDAESLERGAALYRENCLVWQGRSSDFRALRNRLGRARDDFLYGVVSAGWRGLPPCAGEMTGRERWDVVNYFRTFEERLH